jgi:hypothetical protein
MCTSSPTAATRPQLNPVADLARNSSCGGGAADDGKILASRDYPNHAVLNAALADLRQPSAAA